MQCAIQNREAVYLTKDSLVTASWYPIQLPTGIYPLTMYCVLHDHATMSSISKKHIIAIKTTHLCPFQQKLHRPRFLLGHDIEVAIMVLNILIISKIFSDHVGRCTNGVPENPVIDCKIIDLSRRRLYKFLARPRLCDSYSACLMAAISVFTTSTISKVVLNDTNMVTCRATYMKPL